LKNQSGASQRSFRSWSFSMFRPKNILHGIQRFPATVIALTLLLSSLQAQSINGGALEREKPLERELSGGQSHSYQITLAADQFCSVVVDQKGIDVIVAFYDPAGQRVTQVDSPNHANGPEALSLVAKTAGSYRLEVNAPESSAPRGHYLVTITDLRKSKPEDLIRLTAQLTYTEAKTLRDQRTQASLRQAVEKYQQALSLWQSIGDKGMAAYQLHEMSVIYGDIGEFQKAFDSYNQALELYKSIDDTRGAAIVLNNVGYLYGQLGEHQKAIDFYQQALDASYALSRPGDEPIELANIGSEYSAMGEFKKALDIHLQMLALRQANGNRRGQAITLNNIANCYEHLGDRPKALDFYMQALALVPFVNDTFYSATVIYHAGTINLDLGEHEKALKYLNQALQLRQTIGDRNGKAASLWQIARLERDRGNLPEARKRIEEALVAVESLRNNVKSQKLRASFLASVRRYYEFDIDVLMRLHKQHPTQGFDQAAFQISERGRARSLLELLTEANAQIRHDVDPQLVQREATLRKALLNKAAAQLDLLRGAHTDEQAKAIAGELDSLSTEFEQLQAQIRQKSPRYAALTQPVPLSAAEVQKDLLDDNTLLLEYALGDEISFAWVISPDSIKSFELPGRAKIETAARRVYDLVATSTNASQKEDPLGQFQVAANNLSEMIIGPLAGELKNKRLLVVSEGVLQYIPFSALSEPGSGGAKTPESFRPLIADHEIVSLPSASVLGVLRKENREQSRAAKAMAIFADPVFDSQDPRIALAQRGLSENGGPIQVVDVKRSAEETGMNSFPRLRFSRIEADQIARFSSKDQSFEALDFSANRATATSSDLANYRIIHFATHGLINSQHTELSGIVLSLVDQKGKPQDGFLRLYDIYNMNLHADLFGNRRSFNQIVVIETPAKASADSRQVKFDVRRSDP
jgi:tetratricopeptide (TPR) repeat protein